MKEKVRKITLKPNPKFLEEFFRCPHTNQKVLAIACIGERNQEPIYTTFYNCPDCNARLIPRPSTQTEIQRYQGHLKEPVGNRLAG